MDADGKLVKTNHALVFILLLFFLTNKRLISSFFLFKVGIITRGDVVRAALHIRHAGEKM